MEKIFKHVNNESLRYILLSLNPSNKNGDQWGTFIELKENKIKNIPIKSLIFVGVLTDDKFLTPREFYFKARVNP